MALALALALALRLRLGLGLGSPGREHVRHERRLVAFVYEYGFRICLRLCWVQFSAGHHGGVMAASRNLLQRGVLE